MLSPFSTGRTQKAFIALASALQILIIIFYGLFGNMVMNDANLWISKDTASTLFYYYFLMNLNNIYFALLLLAGFALVLVYLKHSSWGALGFSLIITCICVQLYPLVSTFWNNVFVNGFNNGNAVLDPVFSMNGCIRVAISMLVVLAALLGRIGLLDSLIVGVLGTVIYSLSVALNIATARTRSSEAFINDAGGSVDVFLFGGILGAVLGRFIKTPNSLVHPRYTIGPGNDNAILALIGTMFIWCGFSYMSINDPIHQRYMDLGVMNTLLCMGSCLVTLVSLAAIIHLRIGIFEIVFGTISGGVIVGTCSMIIVNPAVSILLGMIAGSVAYLYLHMWHKWIGMEGVVDSTGVIGVYIVNGIISPIFSCILIAFYASFPTWKPLFLGVTVGVDGGYSNATYQLIHLGITSGIAILAGIFLGALMRCSNQKQEIHTLFQDSVDFGTNYQLTTMPVLIVPPPEPSKIMCPAQNQSSTSRLCGQTGPPIGLNSLSITQPRIPQYNNRPISPSQIRSKIVEPGLPLPPIRNTTPIQIRSIIYEQQSQVQGITTIPSPYGTLQRPPSNISNFEMGVSRKY